MADGYRYKIVISSRNTVEAVIRLFTGANASRVEAWQDGLWVEDSPAYAGHFFAGEGIHEDVSEAEAGHYIARMALGDLEFRPVRAVRDPQHRTEVLSAVAAAWERRPDMSLLRVLMNCAKADEDPVYLDDETLAARLHHLFGDPDVQPCPAPPRESIPTNSNQASRGCVPR